ncbi:reverse transcriptase/maturase family protein [Bacillus wiedmannii]|uniref:reverse transcriptase/maturase family protein n=1 Tax=Bacillus wiedmannii TaxID=1890302 RepID=UPI000B4344BB|nr:group II intron reverse transcriptase/maturase [Bacillus thuringiensis serovar argentinensis]OUB45247.1 group II intron reverse transcriptase/maturase [Bacillus thuringiensis serovar argentinensis]OUB46539.1 group II intron reverse transcriptase/maturase [Bacillus thuringiensis serovar argentinensis]OUB46852.1 group II intron reverse transcriptase/maturase [Bacillus thuringiensis serovar argentinensis]OUB47112.1 group II intron reverse transcriptase/maturase [Bacillus thuringiensis serovar a
MQLPEVVIDNLMKKSQSNQQYMFQRLYRNLYNREFFLEAYGKLSKNPGNMTKGTDKKTIDGMSLQRIERLIEQLKNQEYKPNPSKRIYIEKKNSTKKRPLGLPSIDDKLVQEVARRILEAIYEPIFKETSHGFRPNKSCHTALIQLKKNFTGVKWFVEGDIKGFFDNIDHHILIQLLRKRIKDEKFIQLIWKFLKAGYLENWQYHRTFSGTPQGGIISPILSNIYLHELDVFMEKFVDTFNQGKSRRRTKEYREFENRLSRLKKTESEWEKMTDEERASNIRERAEIYKERENVPALNPMDNTFKRMKYVRYADDFIIGVIGSKNDAEEIKKEIKEFLDVNLKIELSESKTYITNANKKKARFLGYDITTQNSYKRKTSRGHYQRFQGNILLYVPYEKWVQKLVEKKMIKMDGKQWTSQCRTELISIDDLEIINVYDSELRGFYEYYKIANNVSVLNKMAYFVEYSMYKTFASKYRKSMKKIIAKYSKNGEFTVEYQTKSGMKEKRLIKSFKKVTKLSESKEIDTIPNTLKYSGRTSLIERLQAEKCEYCGATGVKLEIHHVRKLKDIKRKKQLEKWEERMISRNRRTIALCGPGQGNDCHKRLHKGTLH